MTRRTWMLVAKTLLSIVIVGWLVSMLDLGRLLVAVERLGLWPLLAAAVVFLLQAMVVAWRWRRIVQRLGGGFPLRDSIALVLTGIFFNQVLPTSVGGDVVRVLGLHRLGTAQGTAFNSVAIERLSGVTALGLMITVCLPSLWAELPTVARIPLALGGPGLLLLVVGLAFMDRLPVPGRLARLFRPAAQLSQALRVLGSQPGAPQELAVLGVVAQMGVIVPAWLLGHALGIEQSLAVFVVAVGGAILLSTLPISLGGWGVREATFVGLFGVVGVQAEKVVAMSVIWALLPAVVSLPAGLFWYRRGRTAQRADSDAQTKP